jgi:hypothetical protein
MLYCQPSGSSLFAKQLKAGVSCGASWVCIFVLNGATQAQRLEG